MRYSPRPAEPLPLVPALLLPDLLPPYLLLHHDAVPLPPPFLRPPLLHGSSLLFLPAHLARPLRALRLPVRVGERAAEHGLRVRDRPGLAALARGRRLLLPWRGHVQRGRDDGQRGRHAEPAELEPRVGEESEPEPDAGRELGV